MKLVILEPLGVEQEKLLALAEEKLTDRVEIEAYDTRVTDADALAERAKDADIVVLSNLPFRKEVMERCPKRSRAWIMWIWIIAGKGESW